MRERQSGRSAGSTEDTGLYSTEPRQGKGAVRVEEGHHRRMVVEATKLEARHTTRLSNLRKVLKHEMLFTSLRVDWQLSREDTSSQLDASRQDMLAELRTQLSTLHHLPRVDDQITHLGTIIQDATARANQMEQAIQSVQLAVQNVPQDLESLRHEIDASSQRARVFADDQRTLMRQYEDNAVEREMQLFQRLVETGTNDRTIVATELAAINSRLVHLNDNHYGKRLSAGYHQGQAYPAPLISETTEIQCLFFKYSYQRQVPRASALVDTGRQRRDIQDTPWLRLVIPSWFLSSRWAFVVTKAVSGWQYSLRMHRILPNDAEVFKMCEQGDVEGLRSSITRREISIYDQNESGHTLLHISAASLE